MKFPWENKKKNWLIKWGIFLVPLSFICQITYTFFVGYNNMELPISESTKSVQILVFTYFFGFLIVPFYEEFMFRGFLLKNKWLAFLSLTSAFFLIVVLYESWVYLFGFYLVLFLLWYKKGRGTTSIFNLLLIGNAFLFSLLHFDLTDLQSPVVLFQIFFIIGLAFICQWLTINYNLLRAIIFHGTWNFIALSLSFIPLQFPDDTKHVVENNKIKITWQETELFGRKNILTYDTPYKATYKTYLLKGIIDTEDKKTNQLKDNYIQKDTDKRYNVQVLLKDTLLWQSHYLYAKEALKLLEKEGLLKKIRE